ncbi:hypothetical protein OK015_19865 [Mycobacterium sp. Aquia_216]|uniref:hypothetical protein n=1 Tax=Mycobacterium sp. Aquia_216 TaxID=2991729 RepID=UPI00227D5E18|nr:hypothetical protein [Mycobacterium sp. Aquia_216]WAJ43454.1 hypothetical protein OK015_19865 [Mycobacterium sp. Aquia_216]
MTTVLASYDPASVLYSVDHHTFAVMGLMTLCLGATFVYLISAFRTARAHRAYPAPLAAVGFFAIHDASFVAYWNSWFHTYNHWWLEFWAIALIFTSSIEFVLCYQVYRYGRAELMPRLTQRQFGVAIIGALLGIAAMWLTVKSILDDPLFLVAFAVTAWMPPVFSTVLLAGRRSMRGQTMLMNWCLLINPIGMFGAWAFLDPYFRQLPFLLLGAATIGWAVFNLWAMTKYPAYRPDGDRNVPEVATARG